jgi:hypothetical protein
MFEFLGAGIHMCAACCTPDGLSLLCPEMRELPGDKLPVAGLHM